MATTNTNAKAAAAKSDEAVNDVFESARTASFETPAPVREMAEKAVQQAKDGYSKFKSAAEEATDALEDAYATSTKGYKDYSRKSVEYARANVNAHFDFLQALIGAKTVSQAVELQTSYARQQYEVISGQAKDLSALAQKAATDGTKPMQQLATKGMRFAQAN
ncbi:phasin [Hansschlegelia sp. KR7-227]|jgi:phasin|uniref:phasin n=1 Tax=Hansschlegelia sp. KR7-227 TaxID=3400914 RepID=UPI003C089E49